MIGFPLFSHRSVSVFILFFLCCGPSSWLGSRQQTAAYAQLIDQVECENCISQGCQYCVIENYDSSTGGSPLYCECNNASEEEGGGGGGGSCLTTEEQCEIDIGQIVGAVAWLLLLPCLCACACIAGCVYLCCRSGRGAGVQNTPSTSNYYMQEADAMHPVIVGTEPYSNHTNNNSQPQPQQQNHYYNSPAKNNGPSSSSTAQPFSQALSN